MRLISMIAIATVAASLTACVEDDSYYAAPGPQAPGTTTEYYTGVPASNGPNYYPSQPQAHSYVTPPPPPSGYVPQAVVIPPPPPPSAHSAITPPPPPSHSTVTPPPPPVVQPSSHGTVTPPPPTSNVKKKLNEKEAQ